MVAILALKSSAAVEDNSAVEVFIEGFKDRFAQKSVSLFKVGFPLTLKFITMVVDKAIESSIFSSSAIITPLSSLICVPCCVHI
jgi:hypothetical protein